MHIDIIKVFIFSALSPLLWYCHCFSLYLFFTQASFYFLALRQTTSLSDLPLWFGTSLCFSQHSPSPFLSFLKDILLVVHLDSEFLSCVLDELNLSDLDLHLQVCILPLPSRDHILILSSETEVIVLRGGKHKSVMRIENAQCVLAGGCIWILRHARGKHCGFDLPVSVSKKPCSDPLNISKDFWKTT